MDIKVLATLKRCQNDRIFRQTPEHQRGRERYRAKAVRRETDWDALRRERCDHRHSGDKLAQRISKLTNLVKVMISHRVNSDAAAVFTENGGRDFSLLPSSTRTLKPAKFTQLALHF